ncbi:MAG TPA: hypothetical protein VFA27_02540 [Vicinamibacterales bacterium]|nr:hypothetical protein [Vicinamibacterales bacterium]
MSAPRTDLERLRLTEQLLSNADGAFGHALEQLLAIRAGDGVVDRHRADYDAAVATLTRIRAAINPAVAAAAAHVHQKREALLREQARTPFRERN